jgi:hypothetical protein
VDKILGGKTGINLPDDLIVLGRVPGTLSLQENGFMKSPGEFRGESQYPERSDQAGRGIHQDRFHQGMDSSRDFRKPPVFRWYTPPAVRCVIPEQIPELMEQEDDRTMYIQPEADRSLLDARYLDLRRVDKQIVEPMA